MNVSSKNVRTVAKQYGSAIFGDRVGLILFLGTTAFFGLTWRIDFFITDNLTLANTLVNVADGHLYLDEIVYRQGPTSAATPGMHVVDGRLYGRNYGQLFFALPFLWLFEALARVADPAVAVAGAWSLLLLLLFDQVGIEVDRREQFAFIGAVVTLTTFVVNVLLASPIDPRWFPLMALQFSTMLAAAFVSVISYRLVASIHDRRTGVFAGVGVAIATPVGIWATIPKRHTVTALLAVLAVYTFYRSRATESKASAVRFRALSYACVAPTAWVHAPEGAVLLAALVLVDVTTARSNDLRELAVLGVVFAVALLPLFVTNQVISGDPLTVPRILSSYEGQETIVGLEVSEASDARGGESWGDTVERPDHSSPDRATPLSPLTGIAYSVFGIVDVFLAQMVHGVEAIGNADVLGRTFIRRGNPEYRVGRSPNNLAVLESMPIAALLVAVPVVLYRQSSWRSGRPALVSTVSPRRATDLFVASYVLLLILVYAPRLPVRASITVRYLHPLYPFLLYFVARQRLVRRILAREWRLLVWSYSGFVLIGGQMFVVGLTSTVSTPGEAILLHGLLALAAASLLVVWAIPAGLRDGYERPGAVLVALAAAVTTLFVVLSANVYFGFMDRHAIPVMRLFSEVISLSL